MSLKRSFDRGGMYFYPIYISDLAITKGIKIISPIVVKEVLNVVTGDFIEAYYDDSSIFAIGEYLFNKIKKDDKFFRKTCEQIYVLSADLIKVVNKIPNKKELSKLADKDLSNKYGQYVKKLTILRTWGWVPNFLEAFDKSFLTEYLQTELRKVMKEVGSSNQSGHYYNILSSSEKMSAVQAEELARLNLLLKLQHDSAWVKIKECILKADEEFLKNNFKKSYSSIQKHLNKYGWLTYSYSGPVMSFADICLMLKDNLNKNDSILGQKNKLIAHYKNIKKEKSQLIKKISLSKHLVYMFGVSAEFMYIKDFRKGVYQKSYVAMDPVLQEIANRLGLSLKQSKYCIYSELDEWLSRKNKSKKYIDKINQRMIKSCYLVKNGDFKIFEGKKMEKILPSLLKKIKGEETSNFNGELKGLVSYSGTVSGIVKIVLTKNDVDKVQVGDILVSSSTNPDLLIAMKKAAAFVTDTGGITSHAAILSRELKKPCIVGVKIGTRVFKDGDLVEVDAENGVVRKIK